MKRLAVLLCAVMVCFSLVACGGKENEEGSVPDSTGGTQTQSQPSGDEGSDAGQESSQPGGDSSAIGPNFETGTWSEEMEAVKQAVITAVDGNYFPNSMVDSELLEAFFGVGADLYDDYYAEMPMISTNADTILVIKAKADKVADVETALTAYQDSKKSSTMEYPQNMAKIQASIVKTIGNYVCYVQLGGDVTEVEESGEEATIAFCLEQNEKVVKALEDTLQ